MIKFLVSIVSQRHPIHTVDFVGPDKARYAFSHLLMKFSNLFRLLNKKAISYKIANLSRLKLNVRFNSDQNVTVKPLLRIRVGSLLLFCVTLKPYYFHYRSIL